MAQPTDPEHPTDPAVRRSPTTLIGDAMKQGSTLVQQEVQLAKAELSQKMSQMKAALGEIIAGTVLLMVSLGILLSALVSAVARILVAIFGGSAAEEAGLVAVDGLSESDVAIVTAVNRNLEAALDAARTLPTYEAFAALIVGVLFAIIGGLMLRNGLSKLDPENLVPERTIRQVQKDGNMVREET